MKDADNSPQNPEVMPPGHAVARREETGQMPARAQHDTRDLIALAIEKMTPENVSVLKELVALQRQERSDNAEREFAQAFVRLQAELGGIRAVKAVPNNDGGTRYKYAPFEEIMEKAKPALERNGFTVTFSTDFAEGRLVKSCTLQHIGGHSKTNKFAVRIGSGPPKATECQADGAASTYAKRFALCDCLNIVIETDSDARAEGGAITAEQAANLRERVHNTGSDEGLFLKFAGAKTFEAIPVSKYAVLDASLRRKEKIA